MARIVPDPISLTTHHLHMCFTQTDAVLSSGTGFAFSYDGAFYLITNWHNVTGRHPATAACLSETLSIPDMVSTMFRKKDQPALGQRHDLPLYADEELSAPLWYEHPVHGRSVDVIALPIPQQIQENCALFAINAIQFDTAFAEEVADDAFIIGYPFSQVPYLQLPIWKRASIASEPNVELDQLPKMLVDTATRPGLSGSPVVMQRVGIHGMSGSVMTGTEIIGRIRNFIGVYSGRIGADQEKAQLGIVWKAQVIAEILAAKVRGAAPHGA
jgi:hypothetical protein